MRLARRFVCRILRLGAVLSFAALSWVAGSSLAAGASYCRNSRPALKTPQSVVGVNDIALVASSQRYLNCTAAQFAGDGIGWFRYPLNWSAVELRPRQFDFSVYDRLIATLATHHVRYLPVLLQPPAWASVRSTVARRGTILPPSHPSQFAAFASRLVRRYGPSGTFWRLNPKLPRVPIRAWQIWNEPNLTQYWGGRVDPRGYTRLLKVTDRAIKRVDRHATVITAGMPYSGSGMSAPSFYSAILHLGAAHWFDSAALHAYAVDPATAMHRVDTIRTLLNHHGASRKPLWLTEFGWADGGPPSPYRAAGPRDQATKLARLMRDLAASRHRLRLGAVMLWSWRDQPRGESGFDYWGLHCGLYTLSLRPKPALTAFVAGVRRLSR